MKHVALFTAFFFCTASVFAQPGKDKVIRLHGKKYYLHVVQKGETVYGISKDFNTEVKNVILDNPTAINGITPYDTLYIAVAGHFATDHTQNQDTNHTESGQYIYYKVPPKETLYSLTRKYKVSLHVLDSLNPSLKTEGLRAGVVLRIPRKNGTYQADTNTGGIAYKKLIGRLTHDTVPTPAPIKLLSRYNIALMLTFSIRELDTITLKHLLDGTEQFPLLASISADFLDGIHTALDSLAKQGFNADLYVYSIPMDSGTTPYIDSILRLPQMASMNLIIGPPYPSLFKPVANYALQHQIPVVSPLSPDNSVLNNNPFVSKIVPSATTETEQTADYIALHNHNDNIVLVYEPLAANNNFFDILKKRLNTALSIAGGSTDSVKVATYSDDLEEIGRNLLPAKYNVVIVPYQSTAFVTKMVNMLANSSYNKSDSLCVYGMHAWQGMDVLDPNNMDTLHLHFPSNTYVNYSSPTVSAFIKKYRNRYYAEPSYYSYEGFDMAFFYGNMLKKYGTAMQDNLIGQHYEGIQTSFNFYKPSPSGGIENKGIYMLHYFNYTVVKDTVE